MWLLCICSAWVAGIFFVPVFKIPVILIYSFLLPLLFIPFLKLNKVRLLIISLCILFFFLGGIRYTSSTPQVNEHSLCFYNEVEDIQFLGILEEEPDNRDQFSFLKVSAS